MDQKSSDIVPTVNSETSRDETGAIEKTSAVEETGELELSAGDSPETTDQIKAQIEGTRADIGETIDAIQERLSFSNISEQVSEQVNSSIETAKDAVYEATIGKVVHFMKNTGNEISGSSIVNAARNNPLPFVLIGVGAGLLAFQGYSKNSSNRTPGYRRNALMSGERQQAESSGLMQSAQGGMKTVKDSVSGAAGSAYEGVSKAAGTAIDGVSKAAENTYAGAGELAHKAAEKVSNLGTAAQETYTHYLEEKPWAIGVAALAAGAAIGMAIPSSRYEGELMGEARINLMNKVQDTASEYVDKAKQLASEAGQQVIDEAKTLTEEKLA